MTHGVVAAVALALFLGGVAQAAFGFDFVCRDDTVQQTAPGGSAEFRFTLANTGTEQDVFRLDCRVVDSVPGCAVVICSRGRCVEPGVPLYDTIAAGAADTTIDMTVYTGSTSGDLRASLRVTSMGDTALTDSITLCTRIGSGVADRDEPGGGRRTRFVTCAHGVLTVAGADGGRLRLLDASGRRTLDLHPGPNVVRQLAPGVYFVATRCGALKVVLD